MFQNTIVIGSRIFGPADFRTAVFEHVERDVTRWLGYAWLRLAKAKVAKARGIARFITGLKVLKWTPNSSILEPSLITPNPNTFEKESLKKKKFVMRRHQNRSRHFEFHLHQNRRLTACSCIAGHSGWRRNKSPCHRRACANPSHISASLCRWCVRGRPMAALQNPSKYHFSFGGCFTTFADGCGVAVSRTTFYVCGKL